MKGTSQRKNKISLKVKKKKKKKETRSKISNRRLIFILRTMLHLEIHTASQMLHLVIYICSGEGIWDKAGSLKPCDCTCVFKIISMWLSICLVLYTLVIYKPLSTRRKKIKAFTATEGFLLQAHSPTVLTQWSSPFLPPPPGERYFFKSKNMGNKNCSDFFVIIIFMKRDQQSGYQTYKQSLLQESRRHCKGNPSLFCQYDKCTIAISQRKISWLILLNCEAQVSLHTWVFVTRFPPLKKHFSFQLLQMH